MADENIGNKDNSDMDNSEEWMDILGSGSLKKRIIKEGIIETRPTNGDTVCVNFSTKLENNTAVLKQEDFIFTVGDSEVIQGLELILPLMDKGEICEVFVESKFAYGARGLPPDIPPDSSLIYTVELVDYKPGVEPLLVPLNERREIGLRKRERGNWWFNREEYSQAIKCYNAAIDFLDDVDETYEEELNSEVKELIEERLKTLNNMAAAQMKVEAYDVAVKSLDKVLMCQPHNVKALYRKGKILGLQGNMKECLELLKKALTLDPSSHVVHQELLKMTEKAKHQAESEKFLYRKMLGLPKETERDSRPTVRLYHIKVWAFLFFIIFTVLSTIVYREYILYYIF